MSFAVFIVYYIGFIESNPQNYFLKSALQFFAGEIITRAREVINSKYKTYFNKFNINLLKASP